MLKNTSLIILLLFSGVNILAQKSTINTKIQSEENEDKAKTVEKLYELNKLISLEDNEVKKAGLYFHAGVYNYVLGNYQEAVNYFTESLKNARYSKVYMNRALAYTKLEKYDDALEDFNTHLELLDNYDDFKEMRIIYLSKAKCFSIKLDFESEVKELSNYLDLGGNDVEVLIQRGLTYGTLGKLKEAIYDFTKIVNMKSNVSIYQKAYSYESRGEVKYQLKDTYGALEDLNKAIELAPLFKDSYLIRGNIYFSKNNFAPALKDYNKVLTIDPNDLDALINRAKIKIKLKDKKGGCLDLSRAGELGSDEAYELIEEYCN